MNRLKTAGVSAAVLVLAGCANLNTQSRNFEGHQAVALTVDASQRAMFSVNKTFYQTDNVGKRVLGKSWTAVCAEPSPDALVAYATSLGTSISAPGKGALDLAFSQQQAAASIGLRTQTIQLLRDGMYRLCESYASGAIDNNEMETLQRRYQNMMMGLLAIEQITGPVIARQVALSGAAGAAIGKSLGDMLTLLTDASTALTKAKSNADAADAGVEAAQKEFDKADSAKPPVEADKKTTKEALDTAKAQKGKADKEVASAKRVYDDVNQALKEAQKLSTSASGAVELANAISGGSKSTDSATYSEMVKGVVDIVKTVLINNHQIDVCEMMDSNRSFTAAKAKMLKPLVGYCDDKDNAAPAESATAQEKKAFTDQKTQREKEMTAKIERRVIKE